MNEHLTAGELCYRIIREFEKAPLDCRQTADGAALDAYLCPSNQATLGFGCCYWPDGREVVMGDSIEPHQVDELLAYNLKYCEDYVRELVTVELNQHQFSALCSFRFNTRETTLRNSSRLLPAINAKQWQAAAVAMTEFVYGSGTYEGKPYQRALRGLLRRRLWEGLIFLGYDPADAVKPDDVALPSDRKLLASGVYRDMIRSEGVTTLNQVKMKATLLPEPALKLDDELLLDQPAPAPQIAVKAGQPEVASQPATPAAPASIPAAPISGPGEAGAAVKTKEAPPSSLPPIPPVGAPLSYERAKPAPKVEPPPPLPDPPVPIGQQTGAVDNARRSEEWSSSAKAMWMSRRFWGLFLVMVGRLWMLKTGSNAVLGAVSDPLVTEMFSGFMVMMIGEIVQHWGERKSTRPLK